MTLDLTGSTKKVTDKLRSFKAKIHSFELAKREDYKNLNYKPVFRSSAIFAAFNNKDVKTKITFLNYWKIKNNNKLVSGLFTLRDREGNLINRIYEKEFNYTYTYDLFNVLKKNKIKNNFLGTIECEFYSVKDLKFSFPALQVFYETRDGVGCVHTNQRIFNNIEDLFENKPLNDFQTGFDINISNKLDSFLTFINGPITLKDRNLKLNFFNSKGKKLSKKIPYEIIKPYEVKYVSLNDTFSDLKDFFDNQTGYCKVLSTSENVFNRIMVGNITRNSRKISVTHSYYDCSSTKDYIDENTIPSDEYSCYLPFNYIKNVDLDIIFYPIYSKTNLNISLIEYDVLKKKFSIKKNILNINQNFKKSIILNINKYIKEIKNEKNGYALLVNSPNKKIPTRFTFGLNYKNDIIGSNISSSFIINFGDTNYRRGYHWGPIITGNGYNSVIALSHFSKKINDKGKIKFNLKIYNEKGVIFNKNFVSINPCSHNFYVNKLLKNKYTKQDSKFMWFTIEAEKNVFVCNHIHINDKGLVGGDHSF